MLRILSDGDNRYRLVTDAGTLIGWIHGSSIGFRGFRTQDDAREAAVAAWRTLDGALSRQYPGWPRHQLHFDDLRTTHDGAYEWFYEGSVPVARLLRPPRRASDASFGIELVLPSYSTEGVAIAAAQSVAAAIVPFRDDPPIAAVREGSDALV